MLYDKLILNLKLWTNSCTYFLGAGKVPAQTSFDSGSDYSDDDGSDYSDSANIPSVVGYAPGGKQLGYGETIPPVQKGYGETIPTTTTAKIGYGETLPPVQKGYGETIATTTPTTPKPKGT